MAGQPEVDKSKWVVNLQGKDYATWPWVLHESHERGLLGIDCTLVQIPAADNGNVAIVKAVARFEGGKEFNAYGDASPNNVNAKIATALIRMAETRAKGRALRDACDIGMTLQEELGEMEDKPKGPKPQWQDGGRKPQPAAPPPSRAVAPEVKAVTEVFGEAPPEEPSPFDNAPEVEVAPARKPAEGRCVECGRGMTAGQVAFTQRKWGKLLCSLHQSAMKKDE
jgi:hypothetical protein